MQSAGKLDDAFTAASQSLAIEDRLTTITDIDRATAASAMGVILHDLGRVDEAVTFHARAQRLLETELGAHHPNVAAALHNKAIALQELGKLAEAEDAFGRALAILEAAYGATAPQVGQTLLGLGNTIAYKGEPARALALLERARAISATTGDDPDLLDALGRVERDLGRTGDALRDHRAALAHRLHELGPDDHEVALSHLNLGQLALATHDYADAAAHFREALRIDDKALGPRAPNLVLTLDLLGETELVLHHDSAAIAALERAVCAPGNRPPRLGGAAMSKLQLPVADRVADRDDRVADLRPDLSVGRKPEVTETRRVSPLVTRRRIVIALVVVALVATAIVAHVEGWVTTSSIRAWLESLGPLGPVLFALVFILGSLIGIPGMAMVVGGRLAFGPLLGFTLGYSCGFLNCLLPFIVARVLGRGSAWRPRNRYAARAFELVDTHPIRAVAALRLVLWFNAPLGYSLAFTRIRGRRYAAGCAIALAPVITAAMLATEWFA